MVGKYLDIYPQQYRYLHGLCYSIDVLVACTEFTRGYIRYIKTGGNPLAQDKVDK